MRLFLPILAGALALGASLSAHAVGRLVDISVVDRATGETLTPVFARGEWWVAGRPGARYGVALTSRDGQRTLNVVAVDGVNAISGDTAGWAQTGYVLDPYENARIDGWRKSVDRIAAFEFTALPDSYAARTGRPANVGVIGVAIFRERRPPPTVRRSPDRPMESGRAGEPLPAPSATPNDAASDAANDAPGLPSAASAAKAAPTAQLRVDEAVADIRSTRRASAERLGTGHGAIEESATRYVAFERARDTPDEIVTIHYDRTENLIAMGILPPVAHRVPPAVNPFPAGGRFAADPPPR